MSNHEPKPTNTSRRTNQAPKTVRLLGKPTNDSQTDAGNVSVAQPTLAGPVTPTGTTAAATSALAALGASKSLAGDARVPGTWDAIKPGSLVLATEGHAEGWFESLTHLASTE
jgi:hypothetical protein